MIPMQIPVISLDRVLHVGTLDSADLGRNSGGGSLEGRCLSVSLCPHAWRQVARLGGNLLHEMTSDAGTFIDVHAIQRNPELLAVILDWARLNNLIEDRDLWKGWTFDDEVECWRYVLCETRDDAFEEADQEGVYDAPEDVPGPKGGPGIVPVTVSVATKALREMTGMPFGASDDGTDAAVMAWVMEEAGAVLGREIDGLWWRDVFDPDGLSAPRGALFPERVAGWSVQALDWKAVDDDEELEAMPKTELEDAVAGVAFTR
jgi:hypothetical protein